jgi:hypothetical protein
MQVAVDKLLLSATVKLDYFFVHNISCYIDPYCVIVVVTRRNDTLYLLLYYCDLPNLFNPP